MNDVNLCCKAGLFIGLALMLSGGGTSKADVIHLTNGGTVGCEITYEGEDYIKFKFLHGSGAIRVEDVESIEREEPFVYHIRQGDYYVESRSFDDAMEEYRLALKLKRGSKEARQGMEKVRNAKKEYERDLAEERDRSEQRSARVAEADKYQQRVDLDIKGADLVTVLRYLSQMVGVNIIWDEDVMTGKRVSISVNDIPLLKVLDIVLRNQGLVSKVDKHSIWVTTPERLRAADRVTTLIYKVKQGDAERLKEVVEQFLSEDGKVIIERRRNILFISDRASSLRVISRILQRVD